MHFCFLYNHCVCTIQGKLKEILHNKEAELFSAEAVWTEQVEVDL